MGLPIDKDTRSGVEDEPARPSQSAIRTLRLIAAGRYEFVGDNRKHQRVHLRLLGRFMRADKKEYPCQVLNISPGGAALLAPAPGEVGERIVAYIDHIGRIEGSLVRNFDGGFAIKIHASDYKREKIANQLTWLANRETLKLAEDRRHQRIVPRKTQMTITLQDGSEQNCKILDVSLSGASLEINPKPEMGSTIVVGKMRGRVVRYHDRGIGIEFLDVQNLSAIENNFG